MALKKIIQEMSVKNDEIFYFEDPSEIYKLEDLFNSFDTPIDPIIVKELSEVAGINITERFKKGIAIRIPRNIHNNLREMIEKGIEAKDWYYDISDSIYTSLGESEGCLFLLLLASTSPRNMLSTNFTEASIIYRAFKQDLEHNPKLIREFLYDDEMGATDFSCDEGSKYFELNFVQVMNNYGIKDVGAKINNIRKSMTYYYEANGNLKRNDVVNFLSSKFNPYSKTIKGIIDISGDDVLQRSKVYNFALNLLEPSLHVDIRQKRWYFVTIDSWMIRAFYPYMSSQEQKLIMGHNAKYLYPQEKVMQFATETGMEPHQVQASIWTAKLKQEGKSVDSFERAIKNQSRKLDNVNVELSNINSSIDKIIDGLYDMYNIKPETPSTEDELGYELVDEAPF